MARPQILVLGGNDAIDAVAAAGLPLAGDDAVRRQTAATLIDARGAAASRAYSLMRSVRAALGPRAGLFFAWTEPGVPFELDGFDGFFPADTPPAFLGARLESALRIAVMADEARMRFETLARFGGAARPPEQVATGALRVLVFGEPSPAALAISAQLESSGVQCVAAFSSFTAFDYLHEGSFDAVAMVTGTDAGTAASFCAALRRNSRLFHVPCTVFAGPDFGEPEALMTRGASDAVVTGVDDAAACLRLLSLAEEKRRREALSLAFAAARTASALDPGTGLYNATFLDAHAARLASRAHETDRPMAVAAVRLSRDSAEILPATSRTLDRVMGQAGSMLGRLVRAEDVAAALDRTTFAVAFPASEEDAAGIAARRIAAVLECTAFDTGEDGAFPVQIALDVAAAQLAPGESGPSLVRRAVARLPIQGGGQGGGQSAGLWR